MKAPDFQSPDHPIDPPIGSSSTLPPGPGLGPTTPLQESTPSAFAASSAGPDPSLFAPNNRLGSHNVSTLRTMVSERDRAILLLIHEHKFLTTRQIQRLLFASHATQEAGTRACTRVLARLAGHRFIYRLQRQIGGIRGGSGSFVWGIDSAGDRLLRADLADSAKRSRAFEPSPLFLSHTLAVAELRTQVDEAARAEGFEVLEVQTEPTAWRDYFGPNGEVRTLKPDLYLATASGDFEDHWFFEVDLGTESLPVLMAKCLAYQRHWEAGAEQANHGVYPLVVWLIESSERRRRLGKAIHDEARLDERLFRTLAPSDFARALQGSAGVVPLSDVKSTSTSDAISLDFPGKGSYFQEAIGPEIGPDQAF